MSKRSYDEGDRAVEEAKSPRTDGDLDAQEDLIRETIRCDRENEPSVSLCATGEEGEEMLIVRIHKLNVFRSVVELVEGDGGLFAECHNLIKRALINEKVPGGRDTFVFLVQPRPTHARLTVFE